MRDNLLVKAKENECGILSLDDTLGRGTHWVVWYRKITKITTSIAMEFNHHAN